MEESHSYSYNGLEQPVRRVRSTGDIVRPTRTSRPRASHRHSESSGRRSNDWNRRPPISQVPAVGLLDTTIPEDIPRPPEAIHNPGRATNSWENIAADIRLDDPLPIVDANRQNTRPPPRGWLGKVLVFFGQAGPNARARSQFISLTWTLASGLVQFVVIVALLAYASHRRSPTMPAISEWDACQRPLGAWNAIWVVREGLTCILAYWQWSRERKVRNMQESRRRSDAEASTNVSNSPSGTDQFDFNFGNPTRPTYPTHHPAHPSNRRRQQPTTQELLMQLPYTHLYNRVSMLTSALTLVWFLTAHILEYTSVNTCRHAAPHLWWLTFGILCILYFMILEIFLLGLLVFILGPVIFLFWNIILLCLGRHPLQHPHQIRPEVGKLSKAVVDQIPLVLYIPPPPEAVESDEDDKEKDMSSPITTPSPSYSYPPKKPQSSVRKRRFAFLRRFTAKKKNTTNVKYPSEKAGDGKSLDADGEPQTWEDHWVKGEYPFVRLEDNRAACAICLMDFEEPEKRVRNTSETESPVSPNADAVADETQESFEVQEVQVDEMTQEDAERLKLEDAGEGAQPLRLLPCGHVFHKTCLDPWLMDVSGRCPVCQRAVEIPDPQMKPKKERRTRNTRQESN